MAWKILAESESFPFQFLWLLIFVAIAIANGIFKKVKESREQRDREARSVHRYQKLPGVQQPTAMSRENVPPPPPTRYKSLVQPVTPPRRTPPVAVATMTKLDDQVGMVGLGQGQARREERQDQQRTRRLAAPKSPEADTAASEKRLGRLTHKPKVEVVRGVSALAETLDLNDADAMKKAVIYHEILSAPKALREEQGLWDE